MSSQNMQPTNQFLFKKLNNGLTYFNSMNCEFEAACQWAPNPNFRKDFYMYSAFQ